MPCDVSVILQCACVCVCRTAGSCAAAATTATHCCNTLLHQRLRQQHNTAATHHKMTYRHTAASYCCTSATLGRLRQRHCCNTLPNNLPTHCCILLHTLPNNLQTHCQTTYKHTAKQHTNTLLHTAAPTPQCSNSTTNTPPNNLPDSSHPPKAAKISAIAA